MLSKPLADVSSVITTSGCPASSIVEVYSKEDVLKLRPSDVVLIGTKKRNRRACRTNLTLFADDDPNAPVFFTLDQDQGIMVMEVPLDDEIGIHYNGRIDIRNNWRPAGIWNFTEVRDYLKSRGAVNDEKR